MKAQKIKELIDAEKVQKVMKKPDADRNVYKVKLVYQMQAEKNKTKNYEILKNLQRKRFQSVKERQQKAESLNQKLQKAEERRQLILKQKVEKAVTMATLNQSPQKTNQVLICSK